MEWIGLALLGAYGVVAFGIRVVLQWRRTGDTGLRGLSGSPGSVEWWGGVLFAGSLLVVVLGPVTGLLGLPEIALLDRRWIHAVGVAVALVGIVATFVTQLVMGDSWRIGVDEDEQTALVSEGVFAWARNPIYTAMLITVAGIALVVPNVVAAFGWIGLLLALELQVRAVEEPYLRRQHGDSYARYLATTGRFLPGIGTSSRRGGLAQDDAVSETGGPSA